MGLGELLLLSQLDLSSSEHPLTSSQDRKAGPMIEWNGTVKPAKSGLLILSQVSPFPPAGFVHLPFEGTMAWWNRQSMDLEPDARPLLTGWLCVPG